MKIVDAWIFYPDGDVTNYELGRIRILGEVVTDIYEVDSGIVVWLLKDGVKKKLVYRNIPYMLEYEEGKS